MRGASDGTAVKSRRPERVVCCCNLEEVPRGKCAKPKVGAEEGTKNRARARLSTSGARSGWARSASGHTALAGTRMRTPVAK